MDFLLHQCRLIARSLRSSETVPSNPSRWPRPWFQHRHPPQGLHWLQRCSLTVPGCPSVRPKNCLSGVHAHHVPSLLQRFRQGCLLSLEKVTLLSTALKDLPVLTWDHLSSSCLAAFPRLAGLLEPSVPGRGVSLLFYQITLLPLSLRSQGSSQLFWTVFPLRLRIQAPSGKWNGKC